MNGMELVHRLRAVSALTEVVILTGNASLDSALAALREQSYDYLVKPVPPDALLATLTRAGERWRRRRAEESLRRSEERFRLLVENISDVLVVVDRDGTVRYANQHLQRVLGIEPATVEGSRVLDRVHPDDLALADELLRSPAADPVQIRLRRHDGAWRTFECRSASLPGDAQPGDLVILAQDVTDRRRLEAQAHQAQKLDSIGRLAGGVAHDFNNLLTVVLGYCDLALATPDLSRSLRSQLEVIQAAGARGSALTQQLRAFARSQPSQPQRVRLADVVRGLEPLLRATLGERTNLVIDLDDTLLPVRADPSQLEQVIMNLVVNARDAMPDGGRLTLSAHSVRAAKSKGPTSVGGGDLALLAVTDTGAGMSEETQSRVFEPFFTTKAQGTGLGLATVYGIVHQAGGHLAIDSTVGAGTTVEVYLPLAPAAGQSS
jgi:PAS domain S-box-containing protein